MRKLSQKKIAGLSACVAACILAGLALNTYLRWANSPVSQTVRTASREQVPAPFNKTTAIKTKVFETKIPANYRVQLDKQQTSEAVTHTTAFEAITSGKQLAITTGLLPAGGVYEIADYKYRLTYPETYKKTALEGFVGSTAFQTSQGEITVVITHKDTYAILSVTNPKNTTYETKALLDSIRQNWVWL